MKNNNLSASEALAFAVKELNLNHSCYEWLYQGKTDNYYEFVIYASCMRYTAFVEDTDGTVSGIDAEPDMNLESAYGNGCAEEDNYFNIA